VAIDTIEHSRTNSWPLRLRAPKPTRATAVRTIRIGLLGLGQVGQAVARLAADRAATAHAALRFNVEQALVRDITRARDCPDVRITAHPTVFLRGRYDVVIETLDAVEPARTLVTRLLGRGTSVVTANKALVAHCGAHLTAIAAARGAAFRYEATALAGVPFLGTLAARPLVNCVDRLIAIVNGTTNFVLSALAEQGCTFDDACGQARRLGYAEPDPSRDLDGLDAADKLLLLTSLFGWGHLSREALEVTSIRGLSADDPTAARTVGAAIKPVVFARREAAGVHAFVGPALLSSSEPLASLGGVLNGIRLDGRHVSNLFFSGPGAGPAVTAATLLDDAIQAASTERVIHERPVSLTRTVCAGSPVTGWFLRVCCPGMLPSASAITAVVAGAGLSVERVADYNTAHTRWLLIGAHHRRDVEAAIARLGNTHRIDAAAFRRL